MSILDLSDDVLAYLFEAMEGPHYELGMLRKSHEGLHGFPPHPLDELIPSFYSDERHVRPNVNGYKYTAYLEYPPFGISQAALNKLNEGRAKSKYIKPKWTNEDGSTQEWDNDTLMRARTRSNPMMEVLRRVCRRFARVIADTPCLQMFTVGSHIFGDPTLKGRHDWEYAQGIPRFHEDLSELASYDLMTTCGPWPQPSMSYISFFFGAARFGYVGRFLVHEAVKNDGKDCQYPDIYHPLVGIESDAIVQFCARVLYEVTRRVTPTDAWMQFRLGINMTTVEFGDRYRYRLLQAAIDLAIAHHDVMAVYRLRHHSAEETRVYEHPVGVPKVVRYMEYIPMFIVLDKRYLIGVGFDLAFQCVSYQNTNLLRFLCRYKHPLYVEPVVFAEVKKEFGSAFNIHIFSGESTFAETMRRVHAGLTEIERKGHRLRLDFLAEVRMVAQKVDNQIMLSLIERLEKRSD